MGVNLSQVKGRIRVMVTGQGVGRVPRCRPHVAAVSPLGYDVKMSGNGETDRVARKAIEAVERVLKERMGPFGFQGAKVDPGWDHDGDPVLFIEARYNLSDRPIDAGVTFGLLRALREALEAAGETRFPHIRHHLDEQQQVARSS